ncbi:MAG TPA: polysaccharide deacetylase family protein [Candidatus Angelobacter sp.]|nr:polysaccharide deacetylase family protein [Candidatus Angelobacter sp.]
MGHVKALDNIKVLLSLIGVAALIGCGGLHYSNGGLHRGAGMSSGGSLRGSSMTGAAANEENTSLRGHGVTGDLAAKEDASARFKNVSDTPSSTAQEKLIALTFDDGPRPYVLFGSKEHPAPGLADILDENGVKATFFVVGWRLTPKTWGEPRHEEDIGMTCIDAAEQMIRRGHELEDHTYSHVELRSAERKNGEQWVMHDVDRGAQAIKAVTGSQPRYVRPPDWIITSDARRDLEREGYRVLTISSENPMALRDVNSLDYLCAGKAVGCPKPSLEESVLKQVEQRERKGVYTHILAFHELSTTAAIMPRLITDLKARGYRFVTLSEYMKMVGSKPANLNQRAAVTRPAITQAKLLSAIPSRKSSSGKAPTP